MTDTVYHDLAQRILDDSDHDFLVAIRKAVSQSECDFTGNYRMAAKILRQWQKRELEGEVKP